MAGPPTPISDEADVAADHIAFMDGATFGDGGCVNVFLVHPTTGKKTSLFARDGAHARRIAMRHPELNGYFGVARRLEPLPDGRRGTADECTTIAATWADIDIKGPGHKRQDLPDVDLAWNLLVECPLLPSAVVDTGGGLHAYHFFRQALTIADARPIFDRVKRYWLNVARDHGIHIDSAWDLARVLRIPGTWNVKSELPAPAPVELAVWNPTVFYEPTDFDRLPVPDAPTPVAAMLASPPRYACGDGTRWGIAKLANVARQITEIPVGEGRRWQEVNALCFTVYRSVAGGDIAEPAANRVLAEALESIYPERTDRDRAGLLAAARKAGMAKPLTHDDLRGLIAS